MILVSEIFLILSIIDRVIQSKITHQKVYDHRSFLVKFSYTIIYYSSHTHRRLQFRFKTVTTYKMEKNLDHNFLDLIVCAFTWNEPKIVYYDVIYVTFNEKRILPRSVVTSYLSVSVRNSNIISKVNTLNHLFKEESPALISKKDHLF